MSPHRARSLPFGISAAVLSAMLAACSSGGSGGSNSPPATKPILIGASLSLTGDFSADGQAFLRGYKLWVQDVNASGGLLGSQVKLIYLNDRSDPGQVVTNYTTLISTKHVDLTFGPFSSLLTTPASGVAARNGYAFIEGAGGAPSVFTAPPNEQAHNVFDVSLPIADELVPFANWLSSLPASQRPKTAAYPMADDPFADPPVQLTQSMLQKAGVKTVYSKIYHGTPSEINADVAEAYSVGQVAQQAVTATNGLVNSKIIQFLHSGVTLHSVQGPVKFDSLGRNGAATTFIFQWQNGKFVQVLPAGAAGSVKILNPKPAWR